MVSDCETGPALGTTRADDRATAAGTHADEETMRALALDHGRLKSAFHRKDFLGLPENRALERTDP